MVESLLWRDPIKWPIKGSLIVGKSHFVRSLLISQRKPDGGPVYLTAGFLATLNHAAAWSGSRVYCLSLGFGGGIWSLKFGSKEVLGP